jgi:hypothetical protein
MTDFDLFLMDYTFMLRIIIFLRYTEANNDFKEREKKIISRDVIDDVLVNNIKNYLRWDMFQNDGKNNVIRLFWAQDTDYYQIIEILYNVVSAIELMKMSAESSQSLISNHIDIIKKMDMFTNLINPNGKIIQKMQNIYNPAIFIYFLKRRDAILKEIQTQSQDREHFYYPSPYNYADNFKEMFGLIAQRSHYVNVVNTTVVDIANKQINSAEKFEQFVSDITDTRSTSNSNAIQDVEQFFAGQMIILFDQSVLKYFGIDTNFLSVNKPEIKQYENYYLWIHGSYTRTSQFNFFFSVYDPFRLFFMETFIVGKNTTGGAVEKQLYTAPKNSNHVIYLIVCLIVILFMFCYVQFVNAASMQARNCDILQQNPYNLEYY